MAPAFTITLDELNGSGHDEQGTLWLQSPAKMRVEQLLVEYSPEFPEEITPEAYAQLTAAYHALKRTAWAGS